MKKQFPVWTMPSQHPPYTQLYVYTLVLKTTISVFTWSRIFRRNVFMVAFPIDFFVWSEICN